MSENLPPSNKHDASSKGVQPNQNEVKNVVSDSETHTPTPPPNPDPIDRKNGATNAADF